MVTCPLCDADIDVDEEEVDEGDTLTCNECGEELRVAGIHPLELEPAEEQDEEEDYYEEDGEEENEHWK